MPEGLRKLFARRGEQLVGRERARATLRTYVDDIRVAVAGTPAKAAWVYGRGSKTLKACLGAGGMVLQMEKSTAPATSAKHRQALEAVLKDLRVLVKRQARDLGVDAAPGARRVGQQRARLGKGVKRARRLANVPL